MGMSEWRFHPQNFDKWDLESKLQAFDVKINNAYHRPHILNDIQLMQSESKMNFKETLYCLQIITNSFHLCQKLNAYQNNSALTIASRLLSDLTWLDKKNDNQTKPKEYVEEWFKPENQSAYWKDVEEHTLKEENNSQNDQDKVRVQLGIYAQAFRSIQNKIIVNAISYTGNLIKISERLSHDHRESILMLPNDPKLAVTALYRDQVRTLFAEYDPQNSAETVVSRWGAEKALYADQYKIFLDLRERYPQQKSILFP